MAYEVKLPRLGWDMEEGSLGEWLKHDGDLVASGEMIFTIEGDKAVQEIESFDSGILKILPDGPALGQKVPVGSLLGYIVPPDEIDAFVFPESEGAPAETTQEAAPVQPVQTEPAAEMAEEKKHRIYISPFARRLAEEMGVDWRSVQGSGAKGRIMADDVRRVAAQALAVPAVAGESVSRMPMSQIRKKTAEHMAHSAHTTAPVTLTTEVDATELVKLRNLLKSDAISRDMEVPSYNDLLVKLSAQALQEHPLVNARMEGEEIVQSAAVHIALAVDTDQGLLVPVVKDVQDKTLRQIAAESATLVEKTRAGRASQQDLQGATFTITNLGMLEIDIFTPIINLPQCAILGVGRIIPKQVVVDAEKEIVAIRQRMFLSLTFDHRLIDGAQAARFLQRIKHFVEQPYLWMAG